MERYDLRKLKGDFYDRMLEIMDKKGAISANELYKELQKAYEG